MSTLGSRVHDSKGQACSVGEPCIVTHGPRSKGGSWLKACLLGCGLQVDARALSAIRGAYKLPQRVRSGS